MSTISGFAPELTVFRASTRGRSTTSPSSSFTNRTRLPYCSSPLAPSSTRRSPGSYINHPSRSLESLPLPLARSFVFRFEIFPFLILMKFILVDQNFYTKSVSNLDKMILRKDTPQGFLNNVLVSSL